MSSGEHSYRAFISYRSTDKKIAQWLQQELEHYRLPSALRAEGRGAIGRFFRDRSDAAGNTNLADEIRTGLSKSQDLIVVCTPEAADPASWVSREIELFRQLRPDGKIFPIIAKGEPPSCFPKALFDGASAPLAPDLRPEGDGKERAFLKLVAALTGNEFDSLYRRHQRRQRAQAGAMAVTALAALAVFLAAAYQVPANARRASDTLVARASDISNSVDSTPGSDAERAARLALLAFNLHSSPERETKVRSIVLGAVLRRALNRGIGDAERTTISQRPLTAAALSLDGSTAMIAADDNTMSVVDTASGDIRRTWQYRRGDAAADLSISARGSFIFYSEGDRSARRNKLVRTSDGAVIAEPELDFCAVFADLPPGSVCNGPIRALFSPDERHIAVFGYNDETGEAATRLLIISTHSGSTVRAVSDFTVLPRSPEFITFSSNSERLVWQLDHALAALSFDESPDALRVVPVPDNPECFQLRTDDGRHAWIIHGTYSAYGARRASVDIAAGTLTPDERTEAPVCGIGSPAFVDQPSMLAATVPNVQGDLLTLPSERDAPRIMSSDGHYLVVDRWTGTHSYPTLYQYHPVLDGPYRASKIVDLVEDGGPALAAAFDRRGRLVAMYPNGMMVTRLLEDSDAASMQFALPTHSQEVWNGVGTAPNVPEGRLIARHSASGRSLVLNQSDRFGVVTPEGTYWFDDVSNRIALAQNGLDFSPAGAFIVGHNSGGSQPLFDGSTGTFFFDYGEELSPAVVEIVSGASLSTAEVIRTFCEVQSERLVRPGDVQIEPSIRSLAGADVCRRGSWITWYFELLF